MIVCGGATYGMLRTKGQQNPTTGTRSPESLTTPAIQKSAAGVVSKTQNQIEPDSSSSATVLRSSVAEVSEVKSNSSARIELAHKLDSRPTQAQKLEPYRFAVSPNQTYAIPTRKIIDWSPKRRNLASIKTFASSNPNSETPNASSINSKPVVKSDDEPKPAPLSVSVSRARSIAPMPSKNDAQVADQALPLLSTRPKRKVIQWP
jgi:hypothetical protein